MSALLALLSCTCQPDPAIVAAFDEAREQALAPPGPVGARWTPDLVLHLGQSTVASLVELGLSQAEKDFAGKLPVGLGVTLTTELRVTGLTLQGSKTCADCWAATAVLAGTVGYEGDLVGEGKIPVDVRAIVDVALRTETSPRIYQVTAVPKQVTDVRLDIAGLPRSVLALAEQEVEERVATALADVEPFEVVEIARRELPVRAVKVAPEGAGLRIDLLSEAARPGRVGIRDPGLASGWQLDASAASILSLARREAFSAPKAPFDVVPVPESLSMDGRRFRLGLRLWRLAPPGWWRDYTAIGTVDVREGQIALSAKEVEEGARSPHAGVADPLALLAEGVILDTITGVLQRSVPADHEGSAAGHRVQVEVERIRGRGETIEVAGSLTLR